MDVSKRSTREKMGTEKRRGSRAALQLPSHERALFIHSGESCATDGWAEMQASCICSPEETGSLPT